jgi:hypothetical protein
LDNVAGVRISVQIAKEEEVLKIFKEVHCTEGDSAATHCNGREKAWKAIGNKWYTGKVSLLNGWKPSH